MEELKIQLQIDYPLIKMMIWKFLIKSLKKRNSLKKILNSFQMRKISSKNLLKSFRNLNCKTKIWLIFLNNNLKIIKNFLKSLENFVMFKKSMKMIISKGFKILILGRDSQFQVNHLYHKRNNLSNFKNHLNASAWFFLEFNKLKKMKVNHF
jgi:hypothetical protein